MHPFDPADSALLEAVNRAEFTMNGPRNRDLQTLLYAGRARCKAEQRRRSAAISRKLRLLRAYGLLQKLAHTHRYQVAEKGRLISDDIAGCSTCHLEATHRQAPAREIFANGERLSGLVAHECERGTQMCVRHEDGRIVKIGG